MAKYNAYARAEEANLGKAQGVQVDNNTLLAKLTNLPDGVGVKRN